MGLVAKTPHPAPGDGLNSIGASSGIWMLRYARSEPESASLLYDKFCTYVVAHTWCIESGRLEMAYCLGRKEEDGQKKPLGCL